MEEVRITGFGSYLPRTTYSNATLPPLEQPLTADDEIKIGVHRRGWAGEGEGIAEMAARAAEAALARADTPAAALDLIILANWTQRRYIPEHAPRLQRLLGARAAFAFDLCGACAGFVNGVATACLYLQDPRWRRALVVGSETTSRRGRPGSKATVIYGDGAGAFVLERGAQRGGRVLDFELMSDGDAHDIMEVDENGWVRTHVKQKELNALAAASFAVTSKRLLGRRGLTLADVDWIVPHSGTAGIQATLLRTLEVPAEKVLSNFSSVGNVSSAAIPVALDAFYRAGQIRPGDTILSPTTGTGWYAAALLYTVGES